MFTILFIGDIVGHGGRDAVKKLVPVLKQEFAIDFVIANGENMAGGNGMTKPLMEEFGDLVDVFTSGDHTWDQKEYAGQIDRSPKALRPANLSPKQPGRGYGLFTAPNGTAVGVVNLLGRTFIGLQSDCPFAAAEKAVEELQSQTKIIFVDFHAEATSEKIAMGRFLDGKASAVIGTHTHVPTADTRIFPNGTGYQTDAGMVGSRESILGRDIAPVLHRFTTGLPTRFTVNDNDVELNAVLVTIDEATGHATAIQRIQR